jgi:hypothetical protein
VGTGKTTLLRWLCLELLDKTEEVMPLFMTCEEARERPDFADLRRRWIDERNGRFLADDLEYVFDTSHLCLLCDGLDQVTAQDYRYDRFAKHAFALARENPVLVSSRPSALHALERDRDVTFLALQPFSTAAQRVYFGEYYAEARRLAALSPDLARVPMLAYMLRDQISKGKIHGITSRTELYGRYLEHTVTGHDTNLPISRQNPSEKIMVINALCLLAYRALVLNPPQIQRVEAVFYETLKRSKVAAIYRQVRN